MGKCVGSMGRELGFTTLEQWSKEACMRFIPSPLHPACFPSVRLIPSLPCLCVCYLILRYARNSTSFSSPGSWDACRPSLFLTLQLPLLISFFWHHKLFFKTHHSKVEKINISAHITWLLYELKFVVKLKGNSVLSQLLSVFCSFGHHVYLHSPK